MVTRAEVGLPLFVCDREKLTDHNLNAVYPQILHLWHFIRWQCIIYACLHYCWTLAFYLAIYMGLLPCRYIKFHCLWNVRDRWSNIVCVVDICTKLWNSYYIFIFQVRNGHIKRITDNDIQSLVLEIVGTNVSTTYITCPADPKKTLGIKLPFLVMIIKNLKKYFTFEVQVLDDKNVRRRFRASNYQSTTRVKPFICTMPMRLDDGWNQIQFNLSDFTRRAYGTNYIETLRVQIHANCRIRRVYFSDRLYSEDELPAEFKLYLPVQNKAKA